MEKDLYRLLKIEENTHPRYGNVFVVFANIATRRQNGTYSVSCLDGEDTELFVYPRVEEIIDEGEVIGIQLDVSGSLDLIRNNTPFARIAINTITLVRHSNEEWIQIALYDKKDERIITCGGYVDGAKAATMENYFEEIVYSHN